MIRSFVVAVFALSVGACASETDEPAQEEAPAVEVEQSVEPQFGYCLPSKLPICQGSMSCMCQNGARVCWCNPY